MSRLSKRSWAAFHAVTDVEAALVGAIALLIFLSVGVTWANAQMLPSDPSTPSCAVNQTTFNGWFQSGMPSLNGVVNPANSVMFPNTPNCSFYAWSQQMFLWLTSPAPATYGGGGGRIFSSPAFFTVSPADSMGVRTLIPNPANGILNLHVRAAKVGPHGLPVIMSKSGQIFEVQPARLSPTGKPLVLNRAGKQIEVERATLENGKLTLLDKAGKPIQGAKPIVQKTFTQQEMLRLAPQHQERTPAIPQEEMRALPQHQPVMNLANEPAKLRNLPPPPVNNKLIAQKFTINGRNIFLNTLGGVIDVEQGQADDGVLLAQNGSLIYYVTMVNDVYAYFLTGAKDGGIMPTPTQFPTSQADLNKITAFATAHGKTFPDPDALAVEVKSAWVEVGGSVTSTDYITTKAIVPTYDTSNPNQWTPNGQKTTTLALVGMHVVGSTAGHPEMIWATFEHFGNSPNADYHYNSTMHGANFKVTQDTSGTWLFCATGSAGPFNQAHASFATPNIVSANGFTISPSDVLRWKPFGAALNVGPNPGHSEADSNTEIITIDNSVASKMPAGDVRDKYYMTGATWTINGIGFNGNFGNPGNNTTANGTGVGTSQLSNTTMETFQQIDATYNKNGNNCFFCHQTNQVGVSHVFLGIKALF